MTLESTDLLLVNRDDQTAQVPQADLMTLLEDTDLYCKRNDQTFKITGSELKESIDTGGGGTDPDPLPPSVIPDPQGPAFENQFPGAGTIDDPFQMTPGECRVGGSILCEDQITFVAGGLPGDAVVIFTDTNAANNGGRYILPPMIASNTGEAYYNFRFDDLENSAGGSTYSSLITDGQYYYSWPVTISTTIGLDRPEISQISGKDGAFYAAPTEPKYITQNSVGDIINYDDVSGLTNGELMGLRPIEEPPTGSPPPGQGLNFDVVFNNGELKVARINSGGAGYVNYGIIYADLALLGGSANHPLTTFCNPTVGASCKIRISAFGTPNEGTTGAHRRTFIQVSDREDFWDATSIKYNGNDPNPSPDNTYEVDTSTYGYGKKIYIRAKYQANSTDAATGERYESDWSPTVRVIATPPALFVTQADIRCINDNKAVSAGGVYADQAGSMFEVENTTYQLLPGTYFAYCVNTNLYSNLPPDLSPIYGGLENQYGKGGAGGGQNVRDAIWMETRGTMLLRVKEVNSSGEVQFIERISDEVYGMTDEHKGGLTVTFTEVAMPAGDGNGSGLQVTFSTNADDQYQVSSIVAGGADYEVGDILSFRDRFSWGKPEDFNSSLDKGWHLLGGKGGKSAGYPQWIGNGAPGNTGASGGPATYALTPSDGGGGGVANGYDNGGGGGAGWVGGDGTGATPGNSNGNGGGAGGSTFHPSFGWGSGNIKGRSQRYNGITYVQFAVNGFWLPPMTQESGLLKLTDESYSEYTDVATSDVKDNVSVTRFGVFVDNNPTTPRTFNVSYGEDGVVALNGTDRLSVKAEIGTELAFSSALHIYELEGGLVSSAESWTPTEAKTYKYGSADDPDKGGTITVTGDDPTTFSVGGDDQPKRARNKDGTYRGDDPSTPDVNEAWEGGKSKRSTRKGGR